ncbi:hypothetical protein MNEG_1661 [Monoraphidium neglectum]|uniref:ubiquitinyl hydrolase 1 n=1 Tax=Monoraphidium neglectum TaxID=145388 RepID=A0A0D2N193_9CHLO|nr:hypothetical protein MNEG_1661 [Monoraphidium neglectum]KIZ06297.1 hypothetical protein MNEG_1661 [Monoraphidium neglectum]|eukprot:XP_013905316.1 hypothetical protein MNEG_1661 [Monoraphidium neglectum]
MRATDGKMLDLLLRQPLQEGAVTELAQEDGEPMWAALLSVAASGPFDALLDTGALLASAGVSMQEIVKHVFKLLQDNGLVGARFRGVTYFDDRHRCWLVADVAGRRLARHESPLPEAETFVIYDDARCRGADLKLRPDAVGLVTLGPGLCKDKLMQGAGRLRRLMHGTQSVRYAAPPDVAAKIRATCGLDPPAALGAVHVMEWVMLNTVQANQAGVLEWAEQGSHYALTLGAPERALQPELLELQDFYSDGRRRQPAPSIVQRRTRHAAAERERGRRVQDGDGTPAAADTDAAARAVLSEVERRGALMGEGMEVLSSLRGLADGGAEEEVERDLRAAAGLERLPDAIAGTLALAPRELAGLPWSGRVWCTRNFLRAADLAPGGAANGYLRPPESALALQSGDLVLLSEREADAILREMRRAARPPASLLSVPFVQRAFERGEAAPLLACGAAAAGAAAGAVAGGVGAAELASARLFAGATFYGGREGVVFGALCRLVAGGQTALVEDMIAARARSERFSRSDAEAACDCGALP